MKKIILFLTAFIFSITVLTAQNYTEIKSSELPKKAQEWIKKNMPKATVGRMAKAGEKANLKYGVVIGERDHKSIYVFDKDGNYLERAKNMEELSSIIGTKIEPKPTPASKPPANSTPPAKK